MRVAPSLSVDGLAGRYMEGRDSISDTFIIDIPTFYISLGYVRVSSCCIVVSRQMC
jgi:hypothetical protein